MKQFLRAFFYHPPFFSDFRRNRSDLSIDLFINSLDFTLVLEHHGISKIRGCFRARHCARFGPNLRLKSLFSLSLVSVLHWRHWSSKSCSSGEEVGKLHSSRMWEKCSRYGSNVLHFLVGMPQFSGILHESASCYVAVQSRWIRHLRALWWVLCVFGITQPCSHKASDRKIRVITARQLALRKLVPLDCCLLA